MLETLLILTATVNRITEVFKLWLKQQSFVGLSVEASKLLVLVFSLVSGVGVVFFADATTTVFIDAPLAIHHPLMTRIVAGLAVGLGADFLHILFDLLHQLKAQSAGQG